MTTVQIELPGHLAEQARSAGLFSFLKIQAILRAHLRGEAIEKLRAMGARQPVEELTPEIEQEIVDAVREVRAERRQPNATEGEPGAV